MELYGDRMEFCMIELNALDWELQEARVKYETLKARGLPVFVMEPVRGGRLASFSPETEERLKALRPGDSMAAWAFRWLQTLPGLAATLSGMSSMGQLEDNLKTFEKEGPLTLIQKGVYEDVIGSLAEMVPCTDCRYCVPDCKQGLQIPTFIRLYNDCRVEPSMVARMAVDAMRPSERPSACVDCGTCVDLCPQGIGIPGILKELTEILDKLPRFIPPREED
jgi:predicted aldo/keto reductase-like oxidoreductase